MTLVQDIRAGIKALQPHNFTIHDQLDARGFAVILIPSAEAPLQVHDDELSIQLRIAAGGRFFTLFSPLALVNSADVSVYEHVLRRNYFADQVGGAAYALMTMDAHDVLVTVLHWPFNHITPEQFTALFETMLSATFDMLKEVIDMSANTEALTPLGQRRT